MDFAAMRRDLVRDEGKVKHAYQDHLGFWTIGVGRLIDKRKGGGLSDDEIAYLLDNDIKACIEDIKGEPWWISVRDDPVRSRAIVNMRFQLGSKGIRKFVNTLDCIKHRQWEQAAANMRQSLWYSQTPNRAERVIRMIETGEA